MTNNYLIILDAGKGLGLQTIAADDNRVDKIVV